MPTNTQIESLNITVSDSLGENGRAILIMKLGDDLIIDFHGCCCTDELISKSMTSKPNIESLVFLIDYVRYAGNSTTFRPFMQEIKSKKLKLTFADLIKYDPDFKDKVFFELKNYRPPHSFEKEDSEPDDEMTLVEIVTLPFLYIGIGIFWLIVYVDRLNAWWLKKYYTWRGIRFHVQRDKFSDVVMRIDKKNPK